MRNYPNLVTGRLDKSIREIIEKGLLSQFRAVLITSVDSSTNVSSEEMGSCIAPFDSNYMFVGSGVVVRGEAVSHIAGTLDLFYRI